MNSKKRVCLVDISFYMYKMYFSAINIVKNDYFLTTGTYLMVLMLMDLFIKFPNCPFISCEDGQKSNYILRLYVPEYRTGRGIRPYEINIFYDNVYPLICEIFDLTRFKVKYCEADLIMAWQNAYLLENDIDTVIISTDKDLLQLLNPENRTLVYRKERVYDYQSLTAEYDIKPHQFVSYYSLLGDSVDALPGIKGVGMNTTKCLLKDYDNIDEIYSNLDIIKRDKPSVAEKLVKYKRDLVLTKLLFTLPKKRYYKYIHHSRLKPVKMDSCVRLIKLTHQLNFSATQSMRILLKVRKLANILKTTKDEW